MSTSMFQKLAPELRNEIYELVLCQPDGVVVVDLQSGTPVLDCKTKQRRNLLALTKTCKQIHNEANTIFYSVNRFRLQSQQLGHDNDYEAVDEACVGWKGGLHEWLDIVGELNVARIGCIEVSVGTWKILKHGLEESSARSIQGLQWAFAKTHANVQITMMVQWHKWIQDGIGPSCLGLPLNDHRSALRELEAFLKGQKRELEDLVSKARARSKIGSEVTDEFNLQSRELWSLLHFMYSSQADE